MKNIGILFIIFLVFTKCSTKETNPLLEAFETPYKVPPFDKIELKHYMPAFEQAMKHHQQEIKQIASTTSSPTFENTIEAMEHSGSLLTRVESIFHNINSANTNDRLQQIAKKIAPMLASHHDDIRLNGDLFERIKTVYQQRDKLNLSNEQEKLLEDYYKMFVRGGAHLNEREKQTFRKINEDLSVLSLQFGENILKETNRFELVIENKDDLSGLPENVVQAARETAIERGHDGKWVFTLHKPSLIPFLQYSDKRNLRQKMLQAYSRQGNHNDELDNKDIVAKMTALRVKRAKLLGYDTHADYVLERNMAKTPHNVYTLLNKIWKPALKQAKLEAQELQKLIYKEGNDFTLEPWDWWYYAEKLKKLKYELNEEELRPYFELEKVKKGVFTVANKLWGIQFERLENVPVYHPDVVAYKVKEADGSHIGILYTDYFPRASKRGGAWMSSYQKQYYENGNRVAPIITNVCNFTKPTKTQPSLLSLDEVETLFHEFGHALHGLLSDCRYESLSGTDVPRDFVELPSQIMENWATHPRVLKMYATHYQTGDPIPDELIEKIQKTNHFNQGFKTVELLAASFLDMDWHTLSEPTQMDVETFEEQSMDKIGLISEIIVRYKSPYFRHIFASGYSSGYYSYTWSAVLDADAFQVFTNNGLFDQKTAKLFRNNILAKGGTADPMSLYKNFKGTEPEIEALLIRKGFDASS